MFRCNSPSLAHPPAAGLKCMVSITRGTLDSTHPNKSTPGDNIFKGQKLVPGCALMRVIRYRPQFVKHPMSTPFFLRQYPEILHVFYEPLLFKCFFRHVFLCIFWDFADFWGLDPKFLSILLRLHRSCEVSIGLDKASCSEAGGSRPGYTSALSAQRAAILETKSRHRSYSARGMARVV